MFASQTLGDLRTTQVQFLACRTEEVFIPLDEQYGKKHFRRNLAHGSKLGIFEFPKKSKCIRTFAKGHEVVNVIFEQFK